MTIATNRELNLKNKANFYPQQNRTQVISVTSGKGGVGKTTTTVNLAIALVQLQKKVLILDADLGLANINILLGFKPQSTIDDVIRKSAKLKDVIVSHNSGIDIIPAGSGVQEVTQLSEMDQRNIIDGFEELEGVYDYFLIDTGAGIGDNVLYFNEAAERILVVVDTEPTSIADAYALIKVLSTTNRVNAFDIIVNRAPIGQDGRETFKRLASVSNKFLDVQLNFLGSIQDDKSAHEAIVKQVPLFNLYPSTRASRDILRIAKSIDTSPVSLKARGGLQFFFNSLVMQ